MTKKELLKVVTDAKKHYQDELDYCEKAKQDAGQNKPIIDIMCCMSCSISNVIADLSRIESEIKNYDPNKTLIDGLFNMDVPSYLNNPQSIYHFENEKDGE